MTDLPSSQVAVLGAVDAWRCPLWDNRMHGLICLCESTGFFRQQQPEQTISLVAAQAEINSGDPPVGSLARSPHVSGDPVPFLGKSDDRLSDAILV